MAGFLMARGFQGAGASSAALGAVFAAGPSLLPGGKVVVQVSNGAASPHTFSLWKHEADRSFLERSWRHLLEKADGIFYPV